MRSNDIYLGLPYDVAFFTSLQKYIANRLEIEFGQYTHFVTNMHFYKRDLDKINDIVKKKCWPKVCFNYEKMLEYSTYLESLTTAAADNPRKLLLDKCIELKILEVKQ
jgi:thymidylate synthase